MFKNYILCIKKARTYPLFRRNMMVIFGRVMAPLCPKLFLFCSWESTDCHEPKKCWGAAKGSSKGSAQLSVQPWYQLIYSCVCCSVGFYEYAWERLFLLHKDLTSVQCYLYLARFCVLYTRAKHDSWHLQSIIWIYHPTTPKIIPISCQKWNLWTVLVLKERSFWKHILSQKIWKARS